MQKILVVYYSRTGATKRVADLIKINMDCEIEELIDLKKRKGFLGNILGGLDALLQRQTSIKKPLHDPADYNLVIMGTPVWFGNISPALRTYTALHKDRLPQSAFFCTFAGKGDIRTGKKFIALTGKSAKTLSVKNSETKEIISYKLNEFIELFNKK